MVCNREQQPAWRYLYAVNMQTDHVKVAVITAWVLTVGALGYLSGATSLAGWVVLAAVSVIPAAVMMRLWRVPAQSMSESIREVLR